MATNKLKPSTDLQVRAFFETIQADSTFLRDSPAHRRQLLAILLEALNYNQLPNGSFISKDVKVAMEFGSSDYSKYPNEWNDDKERAYEAVNNQDTAEASASSETEDTEVREAVLSEDV